MTTAATTDFVVETIEVEGYTFAFDGNSKITAGNGDFANPQASAFSLVQGVDCPWRTPTCDKTCYVHQLEKFQPDIHDHYKRNSRAMRDILSWDEGTLSTVEDAFAEWINENCKGGFRWHVSGDIFCYQYAQFIQVVALNTPSVNHWIYTRSFNLIQPLLHIENLELNLSADKDNYWLARRVANEHGLRVCYLTVDGEVPDDLREGDVIFPDYALRGVGQKPFEFRKDSEWWQGLDGKHKKMTCPVDLYGKSEKVRCGPCKRCIE